MELWKMDDGRLWGYLKNQFQSQRGFKGYIVNEISYISITFLFYICLSRF